MGRVTRRSVAPKDESTPKESPKSAGRRGAKKEESAVDKAAGGDSQDTPTRRSGRQTTKEEPKAEGPARGKSAARGRSASRGGKGKKEEEPESKESEDEEEIEEERVPKGGSRSRSKGKAGQGVKATNAVKGGRGAKGKDKNEASEEDAEEEDETVKETEQEETAVKGRGGRARSKSAAAVAPSPRTERKGRGKAVAAEPESDDKDDDSVKSKKDDEASKTDDNEVNATPKDRQRRGAASKEAATLETPSSSGRRGRGQKAEPAPTKTTPASGKSSRRGAAVEAATDATAEKTEEMDTGEEEKATHAAEATVEKEVQSATDEATEKEEPSVEKATTEKEEKAAAEKTEASTNEEAAMETQESSVTEKAAGKEDTATEKAAVEGDTSTSNVAVEESSEPVSPTKKRKLEDDNETEPSELESPNKKRKLEASDGSPVAKRVKTDTKGPAPADDVSTEGDFVVVNKEDVPAANSQEVLSSLPPKVKETSSQPPASEDITDQPAPDTAPAAPATDTSTLKGCDETSTQPPTDDSGVSSRGPDTGSSAPGESGPADQTSTVSKDVKNVSSSVSQGGVSAPDNATPAAAAESTSAHTNSTSDAAPVVPQETLAAPQSQTTPASDGAVDADQPEAMEVDAEASLGNTVNVATEHSTVHQNGTDEEPSLVNTDIHLTSSPGKVPAAIRKDHVPSSTAIDSRKFILNSTFPVELMDPAYCFSVVSYNVLADCHLCRGDYSYTQPQYLAPEFRHGLLLKELDYLDGDIVCLQEVSPTFYKDILLPAMKSKGYEGHLIKRTKEYWDEGEATFVKTSKFDVVSNTSASLADLAFKEIDSSGLSQEVSSAAKKYLDRADVILLTELRCKKTGKTLTVCNIHVVHDPKAPDVQCIQVACAVKQLVAKAGSDQNPHIFCGDFNSDASKAAYQLARDGYLSDDHIRRLQGLETLENKDGSSRALIHHMWGAFQHTSSSLKNAYELTLGTEPPVTVYTKEGRSADHIFFSSVSIDNVGVLETLNVEVLQASGGLPSKNIPSDHLSIKAGFRLK